MYKKEYQILYSSLQPHHPTNPISPPPLRPKEEEEEEEEEETTTSRQPEVYCKSTVSFAIFKHLLLRTNWMRTQMKTVVYVETLMLLRLVPIELPEVCHVHYLSAIAEWTLRYH